VSSNESLADEFEQDEERLAFARSKLTYTADNSAQPKAMTDVGKSFKQIHRFQPTVHSIYRRTFA